MNYNSAISIRTVSFETSSVDATVVQERQISKSLPEVLPSQHVISVVPSHPDAC